MYLSPQCCGVKGSVSSVLSNGEIKSRVLIDRSARFLRGANLRVLTVIGAADRIIEIIRAAKRDCSTCVQKFRNDLGCCHYTDTERQITMYGGSSRNDVGGLRGPRSPAAYR